MSGERNRVGHLPACDAAGRPGESEAGKQAAAAANPQRFSRSELPLPETQWRRRGTQVVAVFALLVNMAFLTWRALDTVNLAVWWIALPLLALEAHAAASLLLFAINLWDIDALVPVSSRATSAHRIAVLIPTVNEPEEVLLPTIAAAVSMRLAHETWVLDDGNRPEIEALARRLGASYSARPTHEHAKAGNINAALDRVDADVIVLLDADHVASVDLLAHTIGYFDDPRIALVQTPQDFYNLDSFEHGNDFNEQRLFYRALEPGRNRWNAVFCCGTGALLRTAALREIGGMAVETLTEDIHTSIRLHRHGWHTAYHNEVLARGLAASNAVQYLEQRLRWGTGAMQVLRLENPAFVSNLRFMQRVSYLTTLLGWFDAWRSLGFLLAPMIVLATGAIPIRASLAVFAPWFLVTFIVQRYALARLSRGMAPAAITTVFELVRMPANLHATVRIARTHALTFHVTGKGRVAARRARMPVPLLLWILFGLSVLLVPWTVATLNGLTPVHYAVAWVADGSLLWLVLNGILLGVAIARIRAARFGAERRGAVRFSLNATALLDGEPAQLLDASLTGAHVLVHAVSAQAVGEEDSGDKTGQAREQPRILRLRLLGHMHAFAVHVRSTHPDSSNGAVPQVRIGLEFAPGQDAQKTTLALALFQSGIEPIIDFGDEENSAAAGVQPLPVEALSGLTPPPGDWDETTAVPTS